MKLFIVLVFGFAALPLAAFAADYGQCGRLQLHAKDFVTLKPTAVVVMHNDDKGCDFYNVKKTEDLHKGAKISLPDQGAKLAVSDCGPINHGTNFWISGRLSGLDAKYQQYEKDTLFCLYFAPSIQPPTATWGTEKKVATDTPAKDADCNGVGQLGFSDPRCQVNDGDIAGAAPKEDCVKVDAQADANAALHPGLQAAGLVINLANPPPK